MDGNNEKHLGYVTLWHFTTSHRGFCTFGQCFQLLLNAITRWSLKQNQTFYHQSFCNIRFFCHIFQKACGVGVCLQIPDLAYSGRFLMLYCPNLHTEWNVLGFVHELEQEFLLLKSIFSPVRNNLVFNLEHQRRCLACSSRWRCYNFFEQNWAFSLYSGATTHWQGATNSCRMYIFAAGTPLASGMKWCLNLRTWGGGIEEPARCEVSIKPRVAELISL